LKKTKKTECDLNVKNMCFIDVFKTHLCKLPEQAASRHETVISFSMLKWTKKNKGGLQKHDSFGAFIPTTHGNIN